MLFLKIAVGALFLWNPLYGLYDFLPDFIGYALILSALSIPRILGESFDDASGDFYKLFWISVIKTVVSLGLPILGDSASTLALLSDGIMVFLYISLFAGLEGYFMFRAFRRLFSGLEHLSPFDKKGTMIKKSAGVQKLTLFFVIMRNLAAAFPELTSLTATNSSSVNLYEYDSSKMHLALLILSVVYAALLGIGWLISFIPYILSLRSDRELCSCLKEACDREIVALPGFFLRRRTKTAFNLFAAALIFFADVHFYYYDVLPDFIGFALIFAGLCIISKHLFCVKSMTAACVLGLISLVCFVFETYAITNRYYNFRIDMELIPAFERMSVITVGAESIVLAAICCVLFGFIYRYADKYGRDEDFDKRKLKKHTAFSVILISLMAIVQFLREMLLERYDFLSFLSLIVSAVAVCYTVSKLSTIRRSVLRAQRSVPLKAEPDLGGNL